MHQLDHHIQNYLFFCHSQKELNSKTIKAYRIDLTQFADFMRDELEPFQKPALTSFLSFLHERYQPKSTKRKIASLKAFVHYLEFEEILDYDPFHRITLSFREPKLLPKTIPSSTIQLFLNTLYGRKQSELTPYQFKCVVRDIAVIELLFATGMRISELCSLRQVDMNLIEHTLLIFGKGSKERILHIGNHDVISALKVYMDLFQDELNRFDWLFVNRLGNRISEQSVRFMINKYAEMAGISLHITPHMFRHSFATLLLESDVDIRYIQKMLGHSSITTTQIYTSVSMHKQREILETKHPRNWMEVNGG